MRYLIRAMIFVALIILLLILLNSFNYDTVALNKTIDSMDAVGSWYPIGNGSNPKITLAPGQSINRNDKSIKIEYLNDGCDWIGIAKEDININDLAEAKGLKFMYKGSTDTYLREVKLEYKDGTQFVASRNLMADADKWFSHTVLFSDFICKSPEMTCECYNNYNSYINLKNVKRIVFVATVCKNSDWFLIDNIQSIPKDRKSFWQIIKENITTVNIFLSTIFALLGGLLRGILDDRVKRRQRTQLQADGASKSQPHENDSRLS